MDESCLTTDGERVYTAAACNFIYIQLESFINVFHGETLLSRKVHTALSAGRQSEAVLQVDLLKQGCW